MTYFANIHNLNDLKKSFHALALKFHPDCGGSDEAMKALNAEYTAKFEELKRCQNGAAKADTSGSIKATTEAPEEFINIISALLRLDGLTIELCGCWLWISGNTKEHKEAIKAAGCHWAATKKMWSWHHAEDGSCFYRGKRSMADIRNKYGSTVYTANRTESLPA